MNMTNDEKKTNQRLMRRRYAELKSKKQKGALLDQFCANAGPRAGAPSRRSRGARRLGGMQAASLRRPGCSPPAHARCGFAVRSESRLRAISAPIRRPCFKLA